MRHCLERVKCWYCYRLGHRRAECPMRERNERFLNPAPDTGRGPRDAWGRERRYEGPPSYERNRYGGQDRWGGSVRSLATVRKKEGCIRSICTNKVGPPCKVRTQERRNEWVKNDRKKIEFTRDPVYHRTYVREGRKSKLAHANDLKLSNAHGWKISKSPKIAMKVREAITVDSSFGVKTGSEIERESEVKRESEKKL